MRYELENSMLLPCVHDPRYDVLDYEYEEERPEPKFSDGDLVKSGGDILAIIDSNYDEYEECWIYECEAVAAEYFYYIDKYEDELIAV